MEKVEEVYKKNPLVEQIFVYGNSMESTLVAVLVPVGKTPEQLTPGIVCSQEIYATPHHIPNREGQHSQHPSGHTSLVPNGEPQVQLPHPGSLWACSEQACCSALLTQTV